VTAPKPKICFLPGDTAWRRFAYGGCLRITVLDPEPTGVAGQTRWRVHAESAHRTLAEARVDDIGEQLSCVEAQLADTLALARTLRARVTERTVSLRLACEELAAEKAAADDGGTP
jgi:hypothetical protein